MRLYTIEYKGQELTAVMGQNGAMYTLESLGIHVKDMNELIVRFDSLREEIGQKIDGAGAADFAQGAATEADGCVSNTVACAPGTYRILAPVPVPIQDVICLGVNYMSHMNDMTQGLNFTKKQDTIYFAKRVNRANDPGGRIPLYDFVDSLDYEVELGVILGRDAFCVSREEALSYVLGYTIINDVSARNVQRRHQQWYRGKSLDGYTPMGPCIVTADEIGDVHDLDISCYVNDEKEAAEQQHGLHDHDGRRGYRGAVAGDDAEGGNDHRDRDAWRRCDGHGSAEVPEKGRCRPVRDRRDRGAGERGRLTTGRPGLRS